MTLPQKELQEKISNTVERFEVLMQPIVKVKLQQFKTIFAFLDDTAETQSLLKLLAAFLERVCESENLTEEQLKIVLIRIHVNYKDTELEEKITLTGEKILFQAKQELLKKFTCTSEENVVLRRIGLSVKELEELQEEFAPDLAFLPNPYVARQKFLQDISRHTLLTWIDRIAVPTLIVPKIQHNATGESSERKHQVHKVTISRAFEAVTVLLNDWRLLGSKINTALAFLKNSNDQLLEIITVIDRHVLTFVQDMTDMQIYSNFYQVQEKRQELFMPRLKQIIAEAEDLFTSLKLHHSILEGETLIDIAENLKETDSGLFIIGQATRYGWSGKLATYLLQSEHAIPILLIKGKRVALQADEKEEGF